MSNRESEDPMFRRSLINRRVIVQRLNEAPRPFIYGHEFQFDDDKPVEGSIIAEEADVELRETPENVIQGLKEFKQMLVDETSFTITITEEWLYLFLRRCKWYAGSAFSMMKQYYQFNGHYGHILVYDDFLFNNEEDVFLSELIYPLPLRCKDGCRVIIIELGEKWKLKQIPLLQIFKGAIACLQMLLMEPKTQIAGVHVVIDVYGLTWNIVKDECTRYYAEMVTNFVQDCLPMRIKSINIVNDCVNFELLIYPIFETCLKEKLLHTVHLHGTNWESLTSIVDKSALFTKYGGDLELSEEPFGEILWNKISLFQDVYEIFQNPLHAPECFENHDKC